MLDALKLFKSRHIPCLDGSGHHHCRRGWVQIHCPFCSGGRSGWHLGYSKESGAFTCWRCGVLSFWDVIPSLLRVSEGQARELVKTFQTARKSTERPHVVRQRTLTPPGDAGPLQAAHRKYLEGRGFDPDQLAQEWGLLGTGHLGGIWAWRVLLPIKNVAGRVVAYQGRSIGTATPRYKMMDDADCIEDPDGMLFGIDKIKGQEKVLIVEGAFKVMRIGAGAVGTLGIDWKRPQMNQLRRYKQRFLLFDPEPKAQQRAGEMAQALSLFPGTTEILSGFKVAPDEFTARQVADVRREIGL